MAELVITDRFYPCYGVAGNTHPVYKFHATDSKSDFGFLYCADKWEYADAKKDFAKRAKKAFGRAA